MRPYRKDTEMEFVFFLSYLAMFMLGIVATLALITWIYFHYEKKNKREMEQMNEAMAPPNPEDAVEGIPQPVS
jgi:hypothetical protein